MKDVVTVANPSQLQAGQVAIALRVPTSGFGNATIATAC